VDAILKATVQVLLRVGKERLTATRRVAEQAALQNLTRNILAG
jgi:hypothetical protein